MNGAATGDMSTDYAIRYYGWSGLSIETPAGALFFDPFFRPYCGAQWFAVDDFAHAKYICVTHGHEEHFLDVPVVARRTGATVVGSGAVTSFLRWRSRLPPAKLVTVRPFDRARLPGFKLTTFTWKHRDINLPRALSKAVLHGNATQLSWAWSSATRAPFYSPYTGYHVELPNGLTILNYNEGFNTKMTDAEIEALGKRFRTDVLLGGIAAQLHGRRGPRRGSAEPEGRGALPAPRLLPPDDGRDLGPWQDFVAAVRERLPAAVVVLAEPGTVVDAATGAKLAPRRNSAFAH